MQLWVRNVLCHVSDYQNTWRGPKESLVIKGWVIKASTDLQNKNVKQKLFNLKGKQIYKPTLYNSISIYHKCGGK